MVKIDQKKIMIFNIMKCMIKKRKEKIKANKKSYDKVKKRL